MSEKIKVENNAPINNQTIINIQSMSGNIAVQEKPATTYIVTENTDVADKASASVISLNNVLYNLFVVGGETFASGRFAVPNGRVLNGNPELEEWYASLSSDAIAEIKKMPSLFMSENKRYGGLTEPDHTAYFGIVIDVRKQRKQTTVVFKTLMELPQQAIIDLSVFLGIDNEGPGLTELNVTRWSIKRADLVSELRLAGYKVKSPPKSLFNPQEKIVNLPLPKNHHFIGRSAFLRDLLKKLNGTSDGVQAKQTICGLGGIGKTQLALRYAYENIHNYDFICWIECTTELTITRSCEKFLTQVGEAFSTNAIAMFTQWFQSRANWLLIFDDVNENLSIDYLLPKIGEGHILVTTQQAKGDAIILECMGVDEATEFIVKRTCLNDAEIAKAIAARLGCFPLALEQAAAYINEAKISLEGYFELIKKYGVDVFDEKDQVESYNRNVRTVWNITLEKLSDSAKQLLYCFSYMSADILTLDWLVEHAKKLHNENERLDNSPNQAISTVIRKFIVSRFSSELITLLTDDLKRNRAIMELGRYSLINKKNDDTIVMHGLLQEVVRKSITDPVFLLSVWEVLNARCNDVGLIYNDYHISLPYEQAKAMILNIEALLGFGKEYEAASKKPNIDMWRMQFDFYSLVAQFLTLRGIKENNKDILEEADRCYATACEIGIPLYGGGEDSELLTGAATFTVIQEKHRRMRVNLMLGRTDVARQLYEEVRNPVSKSLKQERHMSFHAFNNFGNLWHEFGFILEAKECYEYALKVGISDEEELLLSKIANCKDGGNCNV